MTIHNVCPTLARWSTDQVYRLKGRMPTFQGRSCGGTEQTVLYIEAEGPNGPLERAARRIRQPSDWTSVGAIDAWAVEVSERRVPNGDVVWAADGLTWRKPTGDEGYAQRRRSGPMMITALRSPDYRPPPYTTPGDYRDWHPAHEVRAALTVALAAPFVQPGSVVADLSCGNGLIASALAEKAGTTPILGDVAPGGRSRVTWSTRSRMSGRSTCSC